MSVESQLSSNCYKDDFGGHGDAFQYIREWVEDEDDPESCFRDDALSFMIGNMNGAITRHDDAPTRVVGALYLGDPGNAYKVGMPALPDYVVPVGDQWTNGFSWRPEDTSKVMEWVETHAQAIRHGVRTEDGFVKVTEGVPLEWVVAWESGQAD